MGFTYHSGTQDRTTRFCVDYRKLNSVTIKDSHLLLHIHDIFDQLSGATIFSTLDLKRAIGKYLWHQTPSPRQHSLVT